MRKKKVVSFFGLSLWHFLEMTEKIKENVTHGRLSWGNFWTRNLPSINKCRYLRQSVSFPLKCYCWYWIKSFLLSVILVSSCFLFSFLLSTIYGPLYYTFLPLMQILLRLVRSNPPHCVGFPLQKLYFAQWHYNKQSHLICGRHKCLDAAYKIFWYVSSLRGTVN